MSMNYHGLTNIWLVGVSHQIIDPFYVFKDGRELEDFPWWENK